jgi:pyroglutamyl-peptidase
LPIIVTGFEPFEGRPVNRSWLAALRVRRDVERVQLPVAFAAIAELVPQLAARADALLLVGEAKRRALSIERVAHNTTEGRADNSGASPSGPLVADGPAELAATWDTQRALAAARAHAPAEFSDDAGAYCCNAALYHALRAAPDKRIGFLHVPVARWPFGPRLERVARAIDAIIETMR